MPSKSRKEHSPSIQTSGSRLGRSASEISPRSPSSNAPPSSASGRSSKASLPRHKIQALESFVKFGRKGKERAQELEFPPDEWFKKATPPPSSGTLSPLPGAHDAHDIHRILDETWSLAGSSSSPKSTPQIESPPIPSPSVLDVSRVNVDGITPPPTGDRHAISAPDTPAHEDPPPEPMTLARRIQSLLSSRPPLSVPALTNDPSSSSSTGGASTADIAPSDPSLLSLLTNASLMNGKSSGQGVFALLDRLRIRPSGSPSAPAAAPEVPDASASISAYATPHRDDESDESGSLMLYAPLEPDEMSEVELAASDCMSVFDDGEILEFERPAQRLSMLQAFDDHIPTRRSPLSRSTASPSPEPEAKPELLAEQAKGEGETRGQSWFGTFRDRMVEHTRVVGASLIPGTQRRTEGEKPADANTPPPTREPVRTTVRWVPSPDKISFQATWWGYRLYLPPPVLDVLNNKRLEAAKRAALITAALQWLLGSVPLTLVPPQFHIGLALAQRLVPYLGYIGAFVAWSWGAMKSFDKGYGVTLTATWLLPIALIPGTWEAAEFRDGEARTNDGTSVASSSGSAGNAAAAAAAAAARAASSSLTEVKR